MERERRTEYTGRCLCGAFVPKNAGVLYDREQKPAIRRCPSCSPASTSNEPEAKKLTLRINVARIGFASSDGSFVVIDASLDAGESTALPIEVGRGFAVVGNLGKIQAQDLLEVTGAFEPHPKHGLRFVAERAVRIVGSTLQSLRAFLRHLPHVGEARARQIIQRFENDRGRILHILEHEPEKLTAIGGITIDRAKEIQEAYLAPGELRDTREWIDGLELGEAIAAKAIDTWKKETRAYLEEDPYRLMELDGVAFKTADEIARRAFGMRIQDPRRAAAAVLFLLQEQENEGHTWTPLSMFGAG